MIGELFGKKKSEVNSANELVDVRDVVRRVLYTKTGYSIGFLRLYPINIGLLSQNEIESKCNTLTSEFQAEKDSFVIYSIPRTIDMDSYIAYLTEKYDAEMSNAKRKMLLNAMINEATEQVMSGQNFEHQFYIKIWEKTDKKNSDKLIQERLDDYEKRYRSIQNNTKRLDDIEIIKLCNLYGNSNTAIFENYDENTQYTPMPVIDNKEKEKR